MVGTIHDQHPMDLKGGPDDGGFISLVTPRRCCTCMIRPGHTSEQAKEK